METSFLPYRRYGAATALVREACSHLEELTRPNGESTTRMLHRYHRRFALRPAFLTASLFAASFASPARAGELRLTVSDVTLSRTAASPLLGLTIGYTISGDGLNVPGALRSVEIVFVHEGAIAGTITRWPGEAGALSGANSVAVFGRDLPPPGDYSVVVNAHGVNVSATDFFEVSGPNDPNLAFTNANGVDVNRVPGGAHHGLIYVSEGAAGTAGAAGSAGARATREGVYVLKSDLTPMFALPRATNAEIGALGPWGASVNSPFRVHVAPDEQVYVTDASDAHAALFVADPDFASIQPVFAYPAPAGGSRAASGLVKNAGGASIHGSVSSVWVEGIGAMWSVYTTDEDLDPANSLWLRAIPAGETATAAPPGLVAQPTGAKWIQDAVRDSAGNAYMVSTTLNDARKYDASGRLIATLPPNAAGYYGISIDEARDTLYLGTNDGRVFQASTAFDESRAILVGLGAPVRDVATDANGWVYALDGGNQRLRVFAAPGDYTIAGGTATAPATVHISPEPIPGDVAPIGPNGLYVRSDGTRFGDGKVDLLDAIGVSLIALGVSGPP